MAYDQELETRIEMYAVDLTKKNMLGGLCHLVNGNMAFGVHKNSLILRVGSEKAEELLAKEHFKVFDITGRAMKGWIMIEGPAIEDEQKFVEIHHFSHRTIQGECYVKSWLSCSASGFSESTLSGKTGTNCCSLARQIRLAPLFR